MEGIGLQERSSGLAVVDLQLIGPLRACTPGGQNILPPLRKAVAIFVILALSEGQSATRRSLAALLWSRNDAAQGLARLRDALHSLRQAIGDTLGNTELFTLCGDRITLRPGAVRVDALEADPATFRPSQIAADLDGLDPALDDWLATIRAQFRPRPDERPAAPGRDVPAPKRGSVIGVCLLNAIGMEKDHHLPLALAEEIATALARIRGLVVISSASVASALGSSRSVRDELGLDFLLEGSLQRAGQRIRVTIKLVDAANGVVCWTSQFEYDDCNLFALQQDVAALVAAGLEPEMPFIAAEQMKRGPSLGESAYGLILRAISQIHLFERRSFMQAGELLHRAIELEPEYSPAHSWLALWLVFLVGQGWARDPQASIAKAGEAAEHAVMLDANDARGLAIAGHVRAFLHHRLDEALPLHNRALTINPSLPLAWHLSGVAHAYRGDLDEARRRLEQSRRLAPRDPHSFFAEGAFIIVELLSRNHVAAAEIGRRVTQLQPRFSAAYKPYLSALGHLGEHKEAALVYKRLLKLEPDFTIRKFRVTSPFAVREHGEHYASGLALAGVP